MGGRTWGLMWSKIWVRDPWGHSAQNRRPMEEVGQGWRRWMSVSRAREWCCQESGGGPDAYL